LSDTTVGCCIRSFSGSRPGSSAPSDRRRIQRWPPPQFSMDLLGFPGAAIAGASPPRPSAQPRLADISLLVSSLCLCIFENFPNWLSAFILRRQDPEFKHPMNSAYMTFACDRRMLAELIYLSS
jgi:hypothetical protein